MVTRVEERTGIIGRVNEVKRTGPAIPIPMSDLVRPNTQRRQVSVDIFR